VNRENILAEMAAVSSGIERCALEHLMSTLSTERTQLAPVTWKQVQRALDKDPVRLTKRFMDSAAAALPKKGIRDWARNEVSSCAEAVRGAAPPRDGVEDPAAMHAMRIAVKKLRYTVDLLHPVLMASERARVHLADTQETLGRYHDLVVLESLIRDQQSTLQTQGCCTLARGLELSLMRVAEERRDLVVDYQRAGIAATDEEIAALIG